MSTEVVCQELQDIKNTQDIVATLMKTPHYQKMGMDGVYAIVAKSKSLGISALDALNGGLYYVGGKVGMAAETMASLIRQAGHSVIKDNKSNNSVCILHGKRRDNGDTWTIEFSMEDARRAGLAKNMYDKYPGVMLYNRAMSMLARQLFPDIIRGAGYTYDELKEIASNTIESQVPYTQEAEYTEVKAFTVNRPKEPTINAEQAEELSLVMKECDEEYKVSVWKEWKRLWGIKTIEDIPASAYDALLSGAMRRISDNLKASQDISDNVQEMKKVMDGE